MIAAMIINIAIAPPLLPLLVLPKVVSTLLEVCAAATPPMIPPIRMTIATTLKTDETNFAPR